MSEFTVSPTPPSQPALTQEDRTAAILAYITLIGFIVAIVIHNGKKTALGAFHLRQVLGLVISFVVIWIGLVILTFIPFIGLINVVLFPVVGLGFMVLFIMGLIAAASGEQKPVPLIGERIQKWFPNAFN